MDGCFDSQEEKWIWEQACLKKQLILEDDIPWKLSPTVSKTHEHRIINTLQYIGGLDISFKKENSAIACGALVVVEVGTLNTVYEDFEISQLTVPYIPGFLAFREGPLLSRLLYKMKEKLHPCYPQLIMVDGNGILHPRGFGLACYLGVLSGLPSIGIGKNLHMVDGLANTQIKEFFLNKDAFILPLKGNSGQKWGAALRSNPGCSKPIFVSVGHRLSLETAIEIVKTCCKYRIPEPIRQADIKSKEYLKMYPSGSSND